MTDSFGVRYLTAVASADYDTLTEMYADDVVFYTPFRRGDTGAAFIKGFLAAFHRAHPGLTASLHDEFSNADGTRVTLRMSIRWHNTGPFMTFPPTGAEGVESEIHTFRLRDGRIVEQWVGHNTLGLTRQQLTDWQMPLPQDEQDPAPAIVTVQATPVEVG
ncbi:putative ester cyclase [Actinoplanes campanulatus]|uniref:Putative ester cyclase n=1 Tax=Actinoplanes campanulatus TaxID=113559 RepID=A0A7W5AL60_9ACTN|nr:ester cyclase [Actinoplanes campanulatus]MBB3098160.1 putative ester cyclase [Actinoplanes campanulatus]